MYIVLYTAVCDQYSQNACVVEMYHVVASHSRLLINHGDFQNYGPLVSDDRQYEAHN